ncbi:DUF1684 domain-containing protein [Micromonospora sp. 4G57]|uniref:DUF1684 domain-containing protein n=1 Tax=Micromonospora sicca TaxID=2202420 RepID=A0A317DT59_9ACTN|nr:MULTISPECIES: DUF1684 domain-containing protein [unclassified Micromonospora]MDZ5447040.1 DUF1684 domain-containing protein [Micromonospora sp. 4G57]MDZ5493670.1 DUF1684 domain-containing protein [Micromonospora sp. 4G53]PWR16093.1 hypothetical protein DKT69_07610 [Micromonospora sp. 4G51]
MARCPGLFRCRPVGRQQSPTFDPSCAYDDRWACPLAPAENRVDAPIVAGELTYHD